ncbi:MAG: tetratricopeptide repeat protein [Bacteroides sp.]|nr:tetratricopeptide repeat protein [Bacteroides sp.]
MKNILGILALLLIGCTPSYHSMIMDAEHLLHEGKSDSALTVVRGIWQPEELENPWKARYALVIGQAHANKNQALTEDSLLVDAYDYYRLLETRESNRYKQAALLVAQYHWWTDKKEKARSILKDAQKRFESEKDTMSVIEILNLKFVLDGYDKDYESMHHNLKQLITYENRPSKLFEYWNNYAATSYFRNDTASVRLAFEEAIPRYMKTANDTLIYHSQTLNNYANILSAYGNHEKAIDLLNQIVAYFKGKNEMKVAWAYLNLSRCYLLQGELDKAKRYMALYNSSATNEMKNSIAFVSIVQLVRSVLDYACNRNFNMLECAELFNNLQWNEEFAHLTTQAKEEANRLLKEYNMNLTIERQRTQITTMYVIFALVAVVVILFLYNRRKKRLVEEKEEELEALRKLVSESQQETERRDDRFFKKVMLQQLGVIRMAASNPTTANQELIKRMSEIANKEVEVDALLNWGDLYQTIDYIYDGFYTHVRNHYGECLNEKEIQLCCLLRANFSTKEISIVTQQSVRTVYQRKTVVRQKLQLEEKGDIVEFLS